MQKELSNPDNKKLENYVLNSVPKISVPNNSKCNHFELIEYSEWFKNQNELQPLLEFPIVTNTYKTKELCPFFSNRIPSFKQPKIKEYIEKHPSDRTNTAKLLEIFGAYSVNNPFKLEIK